MQIANFPPVLGRWLPAGLLLLAALVLGACDSTDPDDDGAGEQEVISNVVVRLTSPALSAPIEAEAVFDEAGVLQSVDTLPLTAGATYTGEITLRNRFEDEDITEEIRAEAAEHLFFYAVEGDVSADVTVTITDVETDYAADAAEPDALRDGVPVGLTFSMAVVDEPSGAAGQLRVVLAHYDEEPKDATETLEDTPERDVDFAYPLSIAP